MTSLYLLFSLLSFSVYAQVDTSLPEVKPLAVSECSGQGKPVGRKGKVTGCHCHGVIYGFNEESNPCRTKSNRPSSLQVSELSPNVIQVAIPTSAEKVPLTCDLLPLPKVPVGVVEAAAATAVLLKDVKLDGKIFDARTGLPVQGAKVLLVGEDSVIEGEVVNGHYQFGNIPPGDYTLRATVDGYTLYENSFTMGTEKISKHVSFVSNEYAVESIVITVTWGKVPIDIDSELLTGKYLLDWRVLKKDYNSTDKKPRAKLDLDDVDGFGPETTIIKVDKSGKPVSKKPYQFFIYNYTGEPVSMKDSEVEVNVIRNGKQIFYMRSSEIKDASLGRMWHVFDIIDGNLVVRDVIMEKSSYTLRTERKLKK